ncbi:hypothetical protein SAMN05421819_0857 [Bryocella elongata]|uniref:Uncharacterized protein n=1 Tax=Bryocella elongata TaxID=863522 RepID=A0A1H5U5I6_9BACT|nr:hypothetical protein [Bryocella elongata]SEF69708.1 hypothetical protein SAMN05421819_0857 [Bryocella elongata]
MTETAQISMMTSEQVSSLIQAGQRVWVAGDEALLSTLPKGDWIGATTPYFMTEEGGAHTQQSLQVTILPKEVAKISARFYSAEELCGLAADYPANGFAYILIPAFSKAHSVFAQDCSNWPGVFDRPLIGWIAGVNVDQIGSATPKVFNGLTGESSAEKAVVMHVELVSELMAHANIINLFEPAAGDVLTFPAVGFDVTECFVNGEARNFSAYLTEHAYDTRLPLVADYMGAHVNVSVRSVDALAGKVSFYAPVFPGVEYKAAAPVADYATEFRNRLVDNHENPVFTCNCILNYLYAGLEGTKTGDWTGPITFGEIAYMLLNQTLVYLTFEKAS